MYCFAAGEAAAAQVHIRAAERPACPTLYQPQQRSLQVFRLQHRGSPQWAAAITTSLGVSCHHPTSLRVSHLHWGVSYHLHHIVGEWAATFTKSLGSELPSSLHITGEWATTIIITHLGRESYHRCHIPVPCTINYPLRVNWLSSRPQSLRTMIFPWPRHWKLWRLTPSPHWVMVTFQPAHWVMTEPSSLDNNLWLTHPIPYITTDRYGTILSSSQKWWLQVRIRGK